MDATASRSDATTSVTFKINNFKVLALARGAERHQERADLLGINRSTLDRWQNNEQLPQLKVALRVARKLGVPVEELWDFAAADAS